MRAGQLRHRVTLLGSRTGHPPSWPTLREVWAEFVEPKSAGREEQAGIRAPSSTLVRMRPRAELAAGQIIRRRDGVLFIIESIDPARSMVEIAARRLQGVVAEYEPMSGEAYPIQAWLHRQNVFIGQANEARNVVEVLQPELRWPWPEPGDRIHIAGLALEIEGIVEGSDDGISVQLFTIPR